MRGHWIGGTRKLNKHWQSGEGGLKQFSRWFTTIKYNDEYYCFAPSYQFTDLNKIAFKNGYPYEIEQAVKDTWVSFGTVQLTPSFNGNMNVNGSYTLEDMRENATVFTRTLTANSRVKVIIPTFKASLILSSDPSISSTTTGYRYDNVPSIPNGAEILWQDNSDLMSYETRYEDSLNIVRNSWMAWEVHNVGAFSGNQNIDVYPDFDSPDCMHFDMRLGYYDHNRSDAVAVNLLSPIMQQLYMNNFNHYVMPFNKMRFYYNTYRDIDNTDYQAIIDYELISLSLDERTIV